MKKAGSFSLYMLVFAVFLPVFLAGCFTVYTDAPEKYGISYDKARYASTDNFDAVFVLTESSGWEPGTRAVVFDFKGDDIDLEPWNQEWRTVESDADLENIMAAVDTDNIQAISIKPCDTCDRRAAGILFSADNIVFKFEPEKMRVSFYKGVGQAPGFGGDGGAGGSGG